MITDALRLCFGTLSVLPVRPPRVVDRRVGGAAMTLAPLVALALAVVGGLVLWLLDAAPLVEATVVVAVLAVLTRGMHLDGLADTADGLGSGRRGDAAVAVMRQSDVGPFGVVTLVLTLLLQVASLGQLVAEGRGGCALAMALVLSRLVLPMVCLRGIPAARPDGLGQVVAGSVAPLQLLASAVLAGLGIAAAELLARIAGWQTVQADALAWAVPALAVGALLCWHCVRRLGGVTGDVLGGCVEVTFTAALVLLSLS